MTIPKLDTCRQCGYSAEPDFIHNAATKHFEGHYLKCIRCGFQIETCADWYDAAVEWNRRASPWQIIENHEPPKDREILLCNLDDGISAVAQWEESAGLWQDTGQSWWASGYFTHWCELPAPLDGRKA